MPIRPTRDPQSEYDRNSNLAEAFGWVLLAGLAVELAFAFVLEKPPVERCSTIAEDVLIVGGVWGEIHFARHARSAGDKLQAGAAARIAEAEARGKEADQKAAEAQLELARFRAKREITTEQREEAAGRLRLYAGTEYDFAAHSNDPEIMVCILHINSMLSAAGWIAVPWARPPEPASRAWPTMPPIAMGYSVLGVVIAIAMLDGPPVPLSKLLPAAWSLANELSAIPGMGAVRVAPLIDFPERSPDISADGSTIHILVGRKT